MQKCNVKIMPENKIVTVDKGKSLLLAAKESGIDISSSCGGLGTCGKCDVKLLSGKVHIAKNNDFPKEKSDLGYVPACQSKIIEDLVIEIPVSSRLSKHKIELVGKKTGLKNGYNYFEKNKLNPLTKKVCLELKDIDVSNSMNDLDRLLTALSSTCGITAAISLNALRKLPKVIRNGNLKLTVILALSEPVWEIIDIMPGHTNKPVIGAAVDIGTTTVVVSLIDMEKGENISSSGTYNKQSLFGSDVISRIIYSDENPSGLEELNLAIIDTINELITESVRCNGFVNSDISSVVCAGNTVMCHFFMKVSAKYLRLEPYCPAATKFPSVKALELGLDVNPDARVILLPSVASYVGGDITAGVLSTMFTHSDKLTLFIDIGTNGELVLGNNEWLVACSCSAGPAFEGSGISCGMRAMDGAIDSVEIDPDTYSSACKTIGEVNPSGICGSGLIYTMSEMLEAGIIDRAGKINDTAISSHIRKGTEGMEYVLAFSNESGDGKDVVITESDIKNLLRAKAAVFAGIRTMLQKVDLDINDIDRVYVAGGFGSYIDISDAINIGLLPDLPIDKFEYVGNSSIEGAIIALLCKDAIKEAQSIANKMTYLELSIGNTFMDEFVAAMFLPHTDLSLFPSKG